MKWYESIAFSIAVFATCGALFILGLGRAIYEVGHFYIMGREAGMIEIRLKYTRDGIEKVAEKTFKGEKWAAVKEAEEKFMATVGQYTLIERKMSIDSEKE